MLGMCMSLQKADAQGSFFPFTKHYWLNELSYNHTLSQSTSNGEWLLAAARQEPGAARRNAIAVFRLNSAYGIVSSNVIGLPVAGSDELDRNFEFEVSCISESCSGNLSDRYIVVCGSMRKGSNPFRGMVAILDATLHPISIREYDNVKHFNYVYVKDNDFYVCGQTINNEGIVLRDLGGVIAASAYITQTKWDYHKIRQKPQDCSEVFLVSGTNGDTIGYTAFQVSGATGFSPMYTAGVMESWRFSTGHPINSKAVIANYPRVTTIGAMVLSASDTDNIYTYFFTGYQTLHAAFEMACKGGKLEDMECAGSPTPDNRIAWIGNFPQRRAYYISLLLPQTPIPSPFPTTLTRLFYFDPYPVTKDSYYSLHKLHYDRNGDREFHAGGYFKQNNNNVNTTTFVVSPEQAGDIPCQTEFCTITTNMFLPRLQSLVVMDGETDVMSYEPAYREYEFCEMGCEGGEDRCGNLFKRTRKK